jgi:pimeloyl-ACP methyl ester carboxylesterase
MRVDVGGGYFGDRVTCFATLHRPERHRGLATVIVNDFGYPGMCAHWSLRHLAMQLASEGVPVLRIDLPGTGDSPAMSGNRVEHWQVAVEDALAAMTAKEPELRVSLIGLRIGALLALNAARGNARVASLQLIQPFVSGQTYIEYADSAGAAKHASYSARFPGGRLLAEHYLSEIEERTLAGLQADLSSVPAPVHVTGFTGDHSGEFAALAQARGIGLQHHTYDDLRHWLVGAPYTRLPQCFPDIVQRMQCLLAGERPARMPILAARHPEALYDEEAVACADTDGSVQYGVLALPKETKTPGALAVFFGTAADRRTGLHGNSVIWARHLASAGVATLRFDATGFGDSAPRPGCGNNEMLVEWNYTDAGPWLAQMRQRGFVRFGVLGLSSGGYNAFQCALREPGVAALLGLNTARFAVRSTVEEIASAQIGDSRSYLTALLKPGTWLRLLRGEVDVKRIGPALLRRLKGQLDVRIKMLTARWSARRTDAGARTVLLGDVHAKMLSLLRAGVQVELWYSVGDVFFSEYEQEFGPQGAALRPEPNFQLRQLSGVDHSFSDPAAMREAGNRMVQFFLRALTERQ